MTLQTKVFGEVTIEEEKIITFPGGIIGFPDLTQFTLLHDEDDGIATIHWLQSLQEPGFAMPVMDPLFVKEDYNPEIEDELLKVLGEWKQDELLVLVTVSVPPELEKMTVNLKGPIIINGANRKACQVIVEGDVYKVKFPIYDILQARKAGE
ncbi:MAG: flagellar assembly protein FliW [Lachnospiraceae bacterium]|jgi:flagellar assembly factor FliW|nr:flagellar assembly protein FliW [Lachnospiraceae bacterium]